MNYIYDILVNFNEECYDFYDWNPNDEITHLRKVPLIRVDSKTLTDFKNNSIEVSESFISKNKNKTEIFIGRNVKNLENAFILSDCADAVVFLLNSKGLNYKKSRLLIDEEMEVIEVCARINEFKIDYKILEKIKFDNFKTRKEKLMHDFIKQETSKIIESNNQEKLMYLYFECFNQKEENITIIINKINKELESNWNSIAFKLYNFFKLTSIS